VLSRVAARPVGLAVGMLADVLLTDPRRGHPVAGFGRAATRLERALYADSVGRGAVFAATAVAVPVVLAAGAERLTRRRPWARMTLTAVVTWAVLGGSGLRKEGKAMAGLMRAQDLPGARGRLRNLCARDATALSFDELARATVESLAENTGDAVVAPLLWGAVAGIPGLVGYRAVNTLDAMVGYRDSRYGKFGRVAARTDDVANFLPSRIAGLLTIVSAPGVGGSVVSAYRVFRRDRRSHPSPNAGQIESAAAGALGVRLGGSNVYHGNTEHRPQLGEGREPVPRDILRAVRLTGTVTVLAGGIAVLVSIRASRPRAGRRLFATIA
jgi:adenosylcobinamide-phosphate synthase